MIFGLTPSVRELYCVKNSEKGKDKKSQKHGLQAEKLWILLEKAEGVAHEGMQEGWSRWRLDEAEAEVGFCDIHSAPPQGCSEPACFMSGWVPQWCDITHFSIIIRASPPNQRLSSAPTAVLFVTAHYSLMSNCFCVLFFWFFDWGLINCTDCGSAFLMWNFLSTYLRYLPAT